MLYLDEVPGAIKQTHQRFFAVENRGKVYKNALLLTSTNPDGDLVQGKKITGIFNEATRITGVEYHPDFPERRKDVAKFLKNHHKNSHFIGKALHSINFNKLTLKELMDYLGFDMCGNFTGSLAANLFRHQHCFADGMRFPMTIKAVERKDGLQKAVERVVNMDYTRWLEKKLHGVSFTIPFGMTQDMKRNLYSQLFMIIHSMPSKYINFNRIVVYKNTDANSMASEMAFVDMDVFDSDTDIRTQNRLERILNAYAEICPSRAREVQLYSDAKKKKKASVKKANTVPFHELLKIRSRADMNKPINKAKITRLAKKLALETGREVAELRASMVAGLNRHWTEVSKARKAKRKT